MFRNKFAFRKKPANDEDDVRTPKASSLSPDVSDTPNTSRPQKSWPGATSINSNATSSNRQHTLSSPRPVADQGTSHSLPEPASGIRQTESSDKDPLGLKVVHRPAGERRVDIVFVHGLGGSSRMTWSYNRDVNFFWPLKFLPSDPDIGEARILTFGYNANFRPGSGENKTSVLDFTKDLLYSMKHSRDESVSGLEELRMGERPIIFIVHSMGGLVVKEAYLLGQHDPAYKALITAVSAIIFLSTPHRNSNLAETLNRVLQVSFGTGPKQFIADLVAGSQTLHSLNERFRHVAPNLEIVSFYETRPTAMVGKFRLMVLEKDSSVLGYPGEISKPLDADHHGVCKFPTPADPNYIAVRDALRALIRKATSNGEMATHPPGADLSAYLGISEQTDAEYNFFHDRWTPGTCHWVLECDKFREWLNDVQPTPRVLWLHGGPASGKSVLSSFLVNHLTELGKRCHYFFLRFTSQEKRDIGVMLRVLAYQVASSTPAYAEKIQQLGVGGMDINMKTAEYRVLWRQLFKQSLFHLEDISQPLYFIIDGVDEADDPGTLLRLFSDFHAVPLSLRVLVASRKTHEIRSSFQRLAKLVQTDTLNVESNTTDLQTYIKHELDPLGNSEHQAAITDRLLEQARRNFLWVHLAVQRINSCYTRQEREQVLTELPTGMEALYDMMADLVDARRSTTRPQLGHAILAWAACAQRPLRLAELADALDNVVEVADLDRLVTELCGGFATVDNDGRVVLIHETARDYLTGEGNRQRPPVVDTASAHGMLLKQCLARLTDPALRGRLNRGTQPALVNYATTRWFDHLSLASVPASSDVLDSVLGFLKGPHMLTWIYMAATMSDGLGLLVKASGHLADAATELQRGGGGLARGMEESRLFVEWAKDLMKLVGKFGRSLSQHPAAIYRLIPPFCPKDSIIYRQFGHKETWALQVSGRTQATWDDCFARFPLPPDAIASSLITAGSWIALLSADGPSTQIHVYSSATLEEQRRLEHPDRVMEIMFSRTGSRIVSCGYATIMVWKAATGECLSCISASHSFIHASWWPPSVLLLEEQNAVLLRGEERCIEMCSLADARDSAAEWQPYCKVVEDSPRGTAGSFPMYPLCSSSFSPDGAMIAFGYFNHLLTVWELGGPPLLRGRCYVRPDDESGGDASSNPSPGASFRFAWHPSGDQVFGLAPDGSLFRWDLHHPEEAVDRSRTRADCLAVSSNGLFVATGNGTGTVNLHRADDLSIVHRLFSPNPVFRLIFSPDSTRLYDLSEFTGNVWELDMLPCLRSTRDQGSPLGSNPRFSGVDNVACIAAQPGGQLYCYGTESGAAVLCEIGRGKICELPGPFELSSVKVMEWNRDGTLVATVYLDRQLEVTKITRDGTAAGWDAAAHLQLSLPKDRGFVVDLLFHPTGTRLLAVTAQTVFSVDMEAHIWAEITLDRAPWIDPCVTLEKWVCHPTDPETILIFGISELRLVRWDDLSLAHPFPYTHVDLPSNKSVMATSTPSTPLSSSSQASIELEIIDSINRLIVNPLFRDVLLHVKSFFPASDEDSYMIFDLTMLRFFSQVESPLAPCYTLVPPEISLLIRMPLGIRPRNRLLVFLDKDGWVCTWKLPACSPVKEKAGAPENSGPTSSAAAVERHYFLPGDWVADENYHICLSTMTEDGTLLWPRNGEVVAVQCASLQGL